MVKKEQSDTQMYESLLERGGKMSAVPSTTDVEKKQEEGKLRFGIPGLSCIH